MTGKLGLAVSPEQVHEMNQILAVLLEEISAQIILLIDQSGSVITSVGDAPGTDLSVLGTLVAGDLSASQEIARLTGQYQKFQLVTREGDFTNTILSEAGEELIVYLQVSKQNPLGWVRMRVIDACKQLKRFELHPYHEQDLGLHGMDEKSISDLTDDALDSMWMN
jgi:hypothetical protein